jgi:hypothetical protein
MALDIDAPAFIPVRGEIYWLQPRDHPSVQRAMKVNPSVKNIPKGIFDHPVLVVQVDDVRNIAKAFMVHRLHFVLQGVVLTRLVVLFRFQTTAPSLPT